MAAEQPMFRRYGRRVVFTVIAALVIFAAALCLFFRVTEIQIEGDIGEYTEQEILDAADIKNGESILLVARSKASENIQSACPALSSAAVSCRLPGVVVIKVNESCVRALVTFNNEKWVFDENAHVIGKAEDGKSYLQVSGLEVTEAKIGHELEVDTAMETVLASIKTILTQLVESGHIEKVSDLNLENLANIEFTYADRFTVKLGSGSNLEYKLTKFDAVIQDVLAEGNTSGTIDVSVDGKTYFTP